LVQPNEAVRLRAKRDLIDRKGKERKAGEEYLVEECGLFLPLVYEEVVKIERAHVLSEDKCLRLKASRDFVDGKGKKRKAGEQWLVKYSKEKTTHLVEVEANMIGMENVISLNSRQYCVKVNPRVNVENDDDKNKNNNNNNNNNNNKKKNKIKKKTDFGKRVLVRGPQNFFLKPNEIIENNEKRNIEVLMANEAIEVSAREMFDDDFTYKNKKVKRVPGEKWLVKGPREFIPPLETTTRKVQAKLQWEALGIYVFNASTVVWCLILFILLLLILGKWSFAGSLDTVDSVAESIQPEIIDAQQIDNAVNNAATGNSTADLTHTL